jgi:hypothetical protein
MCTIRSIILVFLTLFGGFYLQAQEFECDEQKYNAHDIKRATDLEISIYNSRMKTCAARENGSDSEINNDVTVEIDGEGNERFYDKETGEEVDDPGDEASEGIKLDDLSCEERAGKRFTEHMASLKTASEVNKSDGCGISMVIMNSTYGLYITYLDHRASDRAMEEFLKSMEVKFENEVASHSQVVFDYIDSINAASYGNVVEESGREDYSTRENQNVLDGVKDDSTDDIAIEAIELARLNLESYAPPPSGSSESGIIDVIETTDGRQLALVDTDDDNIPDVQVTINQDGSMSSEVISPQMGSSESDELPEGYFLESEMQDDGSEIVSFDNNEDGIADSRVHFKNDGSHELLEDGNELSEETSGTNLDQNSAGSGDVQSSTNQITSNAATSSTTSSAQSPPNPISQDDISDESGGQEAIGSNAELHAGPELSSTATYNLPDVLESEGVNLGKIELPFFGEVQNKTIAKGIALLWDPIADAWALWTNPDDARAQLNVVESSTESLARLSGNPAAGMLSRTGTLQYEVIETSLNRVGNTLYGIPNDNDDYSNHFVKWLTGADVELQFGDFSRSYGQLVWRYGFKEGTLKYYKINPN